MEKYAGLFEGRLFYFNWETGVANLSFVPTYDENTADDWEICDPPGNNGIIFEKAEQARQAFKADMEQRMQAKIDLWDASNDNISISKETIDLAKA